MKIIHKISFIFLALVPFVVLADFNLAGSNFKGIIDEVLGLIDLLVPILTGLAFLVFFWGLSKFILNSNKPEEIKNGKNYMLWGILVLFILLSYETIVNIVSTEFGFNQNGNITLPE